MRIVHIASEFAPIAKVGGLADAVSGLALALLKKKQQVEIILPKYDVLDLKGIDSLRMIQKDLPLSINGERHSNTIWQGFVGKVPITLIESDSFFNRQTIYGCEDDPLRFIYFCHLALEYLLKNKPDIIHLHDWHAAFAAPLLKDIYAKRGLHTPTLFTIHNLAYQGITPLKSLQKIGLKNQTLNGLKDPKYQDSCNLLKGGILFADHITTVSPTYAKEILEPQMGGLLQPLLQKNHAKLTGVLNGIDFDYWNPEQDPFLPFHYNREQLTHTPPFLKGKAELKTHLRRRLKLANTNSPLVGSVTRLVPQKGPELIKGALLHTLEKGGQFVLLGTPFDEKTNLEFSTLKKRFSDCPHVHITLTYDEELSHLIYAASDIFITPSLFEPCGLTPLIAMRYGTLPLVRQTGGLQDTVFEGKNGFSFGPPTLKVMNESLDRALLCWMEKPACWHQLMERGMGTDHSWNKSAHKYLTLYRSLKTLDKQTLSDPPASHF